MIVDNLVQLAADEGIETALEAAQELQGSLETIGEIGSDDERQAANLLLIRVNRGIQAIQNGTLVEVAQSTFPLRR